jgi:eukaryotic-like serine/threonine-protein kinase
MWDSPRIMDADGRMRDTAEAVSEPLPTAAPSEPDLEEEATRRIGQTLASKYQLEGVLGSGGMAHVYRATNTIIGRTVAIKVLRSAYAANQETVDRFLREARTANLVRHPNVIDVIDFGRDADGSSFIVQEFLQGETLYNYACRRHKGIMPLAELSEIMGPVLSAIGEAHAAGVIHRDIKPENIFLSKERGRNVPKVLDFGISKVQGVEMTRSARCSTPSRRRMLRA